jgi:hypothetical protein
VGNVAHIGAKTNAHKARVREREGTLLQRPRHTCEDNIKMNLKQNVIMWTIFISLRAGSSDGAPVNMVMNLRLPPPSECC